MKIVLFFKVLFLLLLVSGSLEAQNIIYSENFNDDVGKGFDGGSLNDITGVDWTLDVTGCNFINSYDYIKVKSTNSGRLEAKDLNGEAVWKSPVIDISLFKDVNITLKLGKLSGDAPKYIKVYYVLDNGAEIIFGSFENDWVTGLHSISGLDGSNIMLVVKMWTESVNVFYFDDIVIMGTSQVVSNDALTQVLEPGSQVVPQDISSLVNDQSSAQSLMKFKLLEPSSPDDLDTKISSIKFKNIDFDNPSVLSSQFEGFVIHDGSDFISTSSVDISTDEVILNFEEDRFTLADDSFHEYELRGYLKSKGIIDTKKVTFELGVSDMQTYKSGSAFDAANSVVVISSEHQISVVGTELVLTTKPPKTISPDQNFKLELLLVDKFGNQDLNSTVKVNVSLLAGSGILSSNSALNRSLENGKYTFDDLKYDKAESFKLLIEAEGMAPIVTHNISSLDINSLVVLSTTPILPKKLNTLATSSDNSETVFNFVIEDSGSFDKSPTLITTMKFFNKLSDEGLSWMKHLAGAVLKQEGEVIAKTTKIEEDYLSFTALDIEVGNGMQADIELGIYFKKSLLPDHARFQVEIRKDHEWKTSSTGSGLAGVFPESIQSGIHQLEVEADRFAFIDCPIGVEAEQGFEISIAAVDAFQNIDIDKSSSVNLSSDNGILSKTGVVGSLEKGVLKIDQLNFTGNQLANLTVSGDLLSAKKEIFIQKKNLILYDDFESQNLSKWENSEDWTISPYSPIVGNYSLKHNLTNAIGTSFILQALPEIKPGAESIYWEFILMNSGWDPSSSNNFVFHLMMDFNDLKIAGALFSVGVNLSGADDKLSLWKTEGENTDVLIKSDFDWNEKEMVAVKVGYNAKGKWTLSYNRLGDKNNWLKAGEVVSEVEPDVENWYSGLQFNFETASRAGELWFDDLKIETYNTGPFLKKLETYSYSILLVFSEDLNLELSVKTENYKLRLNDELVEIANVKSRDHKQVILVLEEKLLTGHYSLSVTDIEDINGARLNSKIIEFDFQEEAHEYDLIINEILADESPAVDLPEYEFIEIYNASDHAISVQNFKLTVGKSEKNLEKFELPSNEYLILCSKAAVDFYKEFGHSLGVSSFPGLTNSGTNISLKSPVGVLMDEIIYSSDWYADESKENGGWSLERIDAANHSWQPENWKASVDTKGGTPGQINSVVDDNPDNTTPILLSYEIEQPNAITLYFSETLKSPQAYLVENYTIDNGINSPNSIEEINDEKFALKLSFASDFESNIHYQFSLSDQLSDLAGNLFEEREFKFLLADLPKEGDLVINEVLFNPYPGGADYVELLNISDRMIDVKDLLIANRDENYQLDAIYNLSEKSQILKAGAYLLLSTNTPNIKTNYMYYDENVFLEMKKMPSFNDDEGRVVIMNRNNDQIDDFAYDEAMHFSQLTSKEGVSLERINPNKETNSNSNWISASQTVDFGTPGMQNSSYDIDEVEVNEIGFKSKMFSPDNDGVDDRLIINFELEKSGYIANIRVYNSLGREVRRLASNMTLSTKGELFWDGLLANKERAPIGIYAFYFELFHPDGEVKTYKKTCVLGGKFE